MRRIDKYYYEKLLDSLPKDDPDKPKREHRTFLISVWSLVVAILIAAPSVYFAWKSVRLTEDSKEQTQKIEKMEDVLRELKASNQTQSGLLKNGTQQIDSLGRISSTLLSVAKSQKETAEVQLRIAKTNEKNTAPKISFSGENELQLISPNKVKLKFGYTNTGTRDALDLEFDVYPFIRRSDGQLIVMNGNNSMYSMPQKVGAKIGYGYAEYVITKNTGDFKKEDFNNLYFKIILKYKDELTGKYEPPVPIYTFWTVDNDLKYINSLAASKSEKLQMDNLSAKTKSPR